LIKIGVFVYKYLISGFLLALSSDYYLSCIYSYITLINIKLHKFECVGTGGKNVTAETHQDGASPWYSRRDGRLSQL